MHPGTTTTQPFMHSEDLDKMRSQDRCSAKTSAATQTPRTDPQQRTLSYELIVPGPARIKIQFYREGILLMLKASDKSVLYYWLNGSSTFIYSYLLNKLYLLLQLFPRNAGVTRLSQYHIEFFSLCPLENRFPD